MLVTQRQPKWAPKLRSGQLQGYFLSTTSVKIEIETATYGI